ncbi:MAG TPA: NADH-quinone oxidoreductase subunit NuoG [Acidimicrobiales bacterium]|jgi:NADH-quinone oxidoreductase subunit G
MADTQQASETVIVTIDGRSVHAKPGEMVISAAERAGLYIPRFCYHPRLEPVGMCRMCIVNIDTGRGATLQPACVIPVAEGMMVDTVEAGVKKAQDGVLEFLLINHPLDCPVCDKGGECPLQDQTVAFGPGESRFVEEKRHFEKPIPISSLVDLDRERCILCDRCTRFAKDVAGDPLISFVERGNETQVLNFPDEPFSSYFSGNVVQLCPVGALTARPYRFKARPWDLEAVESTCTSCSVGCRVEVQSTQNELVRLVGIDADPVNHGWLCDKGRFGYEAVSGSARVVDPMVRAGGSLAPSSWAAALTAAADGIRSAIDTTGASSVAVIGGARLTNEDAYAWARLAKGVIGTDHVDAQLDDGLPAGLVQGLPRATIDDACSASVVVLLGPDLKEELPVLFLRLRQAAIEGGVHLVEISPAGSGLSPYAMVSLIHAPGEAGAIGQALASGSSDDVAGVAAADIATARDLLGLASGGTPADVVCVLGRPSVAEPATSVEAAVAHLAPAVGSFKVLPALRRANVMGALDAGLAPGLLPGRTSLDSGRQTFTQRWGSVPPEVGLDTAGILSAAADGRIGALVLLGADPLADAPDPELARQALTAARYVVAVDAFHTASAQEADVVLPVATIHEKDGTTTNLEGRVSTLGHKVTPLGTARPDWAVASELARRLGEDLPWIDETEIWTELESVSACHTGITLDVLSDPAWRDGVPAPIPAAGVTIAGVGELPSGAVAAASDEAAGEGDGGSRAADVGSAPLSERPSPITYSPSAGTPELPVRNGYDLRLVAGRRLYDGGTAVTNSPSLAVLAPGSTARLSRYDADRLGVVDGDRVRVRNARAAHELDVEVSGLVARGSIAIAFGQPDGVAASFIDGIVTDVTVETL